VNDVLDLWSTALPELLSGLVVSLQLSAVAIGLGFPLGVLLAVTTQSRHTAVRWMSLVVVEVGRGFPVLVLLYLFYRGLPQAGLTLTAMVAACAAFVWSAGAYSAEVFRASLGSVARGQLEAAQVLGLSRSDTFRLVVTPQAARVALPPLVGQMVHLFQATSLASVITVPEMLQKSYAQGSISFQYLSIFALTALVFAAISIPGSALSRILERRLAAHATSS
jgi:polar amino acid transport system permease protein